MKKRFYLLLFLSPFFFSCSKEPANSTTRDMSPSPVELPHNHNGVDIIVNALLYTGWRNVDYILSHRADPDHGLGAFRVDLEHELNKRIRDDASHFGDEDLAYHSLLYKFLLDTRVYTLPASALADPAGFLGLQNLDCLREFIYYANHAYAKPQRPSSFFEQQSVQVNLMYAYTWWFPNISTANTIINKLNEPMSDPHFDLKDDRGVSMGALKIIKADEKYTYLGLYQSTFGHSDPNNFKLCLAGSCDLKKWTFIKELLGDKTTSPDIKKWGNGFLVVGQISVGNNFYINIKHYESYDKLINDNGTSYSPPIFSSGILNEGSPDIREIEGTNLANSTIKIGFHYFNGGPDQVGYGFLKNYTNWTDFKDEISNINIYNLGYPGSINARCGIPILNAGYVLQAANISSNNNGNDFSAWRLLFGDGAFYYVLNPVTPLGSASFSIPGFTLIGDNEYVFTSFLFTEGNKPGEPGELLYNVKF